MVNKTPISEWLAQNGPRFVLKSRGFGGVGIVWDKLKQHRVGYMTAEEVALANQKFEAKVRGKQPGGQR